MLAATATPAFADETDPPADFTISGSATIVSDYRFRGFSQTNEAATIQGSLTLTHKSGFYIGTWGSGVGFPNGSEVDAIAGFSHDFGGFTPDVGVTFYVYPGTTGTTIAEPYLKLSTNLGPVSATAGLAWAPSGQSALGGKSAVYLSTDLGVGIPNTPFSLNGHVGYAKSDSFLGGPKGETVDYSIGATATWKALTFGVSYVNTDVPRGLGKEALGADGAVVFSLGASF